MSKATKHAYKVTSISVGDESVDKFGSVQAGGFMVAGDHVRKYHEPVRYFDYLNANEKVGSDRAFTRVTAEHIGEYEKVKSYLGGGE